MRGITSGLGRGRTNSDQGIGPWPAGDSSPPAKIGPSRRAKMSEGTEISRVFGSSDIFMKIIQEVIKLGKLTSILPILAFIGSTCKSWKVAVEQDELWYLLFRAYYPRVNSARWASDLLRSGWKKHFLALSPVRSVVLWVEDDTYTVRAYAEHIRKSPIHLKHAQSTEEAKAWLTTHLEALHPTLHIITDNVRQEAAPDGSLSNNYNAGRELIEWLNAEGNGFADAPVMLFCGNGSIPFIKACSNRFDSASVKWVRLIAPCVTGSDRALFHGHTRHRWKARSQLCHGISPRANKRDEGEQLPKQPDLPYLSRSTESRINPPLSTPILSAVDRGCGRTDQVRARCEAAFG
jgi:hypothetical protein